MYTLTDMKRPRPLTIKDDIAFVPVYRGGDFLEAIIEATDAPLISKYLWSMSGKNGYPKTSNRKAPKNGYLHRMIMQPTPIEQVDHIDGNPLNCLRTNLRIVTNQQNQMARHVAVAKLGYKGVHKHGKQYRAQITFNQKLIRLGSYPTIQKAARAYNQAATALFGEYAVINEINDDSAVPTRRS